MPSLRIRVLAAVALTAGLLTGSPAGAASAPPSPTGVTVAAGSTSATITWKASAGADYYTVCLVPEIGSTRCSHASPRVTGLSHNFSGLEPTSATDWFVRVRAVNASGGTNASRVGFDLRPTPSTPPAAPTGVAVVPGFDSAAVTWKPSAGAEYYSLCLVTKLTATTCAHRSARVFGTSFTFTGLEPTGGTDWYVRVNATNGKGSTSSSRVPFDLAPDPRPAPATGLKHRSVGLTSAVISWSPVPRATSYTICLLADTTSTTCSRSTTTSATSAQIDDLVPTSGRDYYYRVEAVAGDYSSRSALASFDLPVGTPPSLKATPTEPGSARAWWATAKNAGAYQVQFALNSAFTSGQRTFTATGPRVSVTKLSPGRAYWFRVRGTNDGVTGAWSKAGTVRMTAGGTSITVLTYNLCGQDKCLTRGNKMRTWTSYRKKAAGSYVRGAGAGIIATQESHERDTRFGTELPGYKLAEYYSAKSLFYDAERYSKERSGVVTMSKADNKYAVWAQLRSQATGTRFIVVDAHLQPFKGKKNDDKRYHQSRVLIKEVTRANTDGLPVVYAGDFNSNKSNTEQRLYKYGYDAPLKVFTQAGIPDTIKTVAAADRHAEDWNTANQAINPPLRFGDHVDHVFATKGVKVQEWRVMLRSRNSRYVTPFASDHNPLRVKLGIPGD